MVVPYKTASEGSALSFFVVTPQVLCIWTGSIIPKVAPQVLLAVGLAVVARFWNPLAGQHEEVQSGMGTVGILLSFLLVFKTQTAYGQFWEACTESQRIVQTSRNIAMTACTFFPFVCSHRPRSCQEAKSLQKQDARIEATTPCNLKVRVIAAYDLDRDKVAGHLHTVIRVGSESFKTEPINCAQNPTWNSEIFDFGLSSEERVVTCVIVARDSDTGAQSSLGWLHLRIDDLPKTADSRWHKVRQRLHDCSQGELELEVCFAKPPPAVKAIDAFSHKALLAACGAGGLAAPPPKVAEARSLSLRLLGAGGRSQDAGCKEPVVETGVPLVIDPLQAQPEYDEDVPVDAFLRRIVRLVALYFFVVSEYFRRTGQNAIQCIHDRDKMRRQIRALTSKREYAILYPGDAADTPGSEAINGHANPVIVLYWLQLTIGRCGAVHQIPAPVLSSFVPQIHMLLDDFGEMDKIDKMQFPLPYTQVVKILCIIFVFVLSPWVLQPKCGDLTELVIGLVALGFFGLDEVAEILESPFGNDPNHLDLWSYGQDLLDDLELMYTSRENQLDLDIFEHGEGLFENVERTSRSLSKPKAKSAFIPKGETCAL